MIAATHLALALEAADSYRATCFQGWQYAGESSRQTVGSPAERTMSPTWRCGTTELAVDARGCRGTVGWGSYGGGIMSGDRKRWRRGAGPCTRCCGTPEEASGPAATRKNLRRLAGLGDDGPACCRTSGRAWLEICILPAGTRTTTCGGTALRAAGPRGNRGVAAGPLAAAPR